MIWNILFIVACIAFMINLLFGEGRSATGGGLTFGIVIGIILYFFVDLTFWETLKRSIALFVIFGVLFDILGGKGYSR